MLEIKKTRDGIPKKKTRARPEVQRKALQTQADRISVLRAPR